MRRQSRTWDVNTSTGITARRMGFFCVPDFGSTVHQVQGKTLDAVLAGVKNHDTPPSMENLVHLIVLMSRVPHRGAIWLMQPFNKHLCQRGPPVGVAVLHAFLTGGIGVQEAFARFDAFYEERRQETASADKKAGTKDEPRQKAECYRC